MEVSGRIGGRLNDNQMTDSAKGDVVDEVPKTREREEDPFSHLIASSLNQAQKVERLLDCLKSVFGVSSSSPWEYDDIFKLDVASSIPERVYTDLVNCINREISDDTLSDFVVKSFGYYISHQLEGVSHNMSIFAALALILRTKPHVLLASELPPPSQEALPLTVWMIKQASQGDLHVGLYSWVHYLLPLLPQWRRPLILESVEMILEKAGALTELENLPFWQKQCLIPPCSFEILLRHRFSATSSPTEENTTKTRFVKTYGSLKRVALAGALKRKAVTLQIFTLSLRLAGEEGNPVLAKEAAEIAIWSLTRNLVCWRIWYRATKENLAASVVLLKALIQKWNEHSLQLPSSSSSRCDAMSEFIQRLFTISMVVAGEGNTVLASEASEIAVWSLSKNFFCWTRWDYLLDKVNLKASLAILTTLVRDFEAHSTKLPPSSSEGITKFIFRIFTLSLRIAGDGHPRLASEAVAIAIWALTKNISCWLRWDYLYEENLKASVVLLETLVEDSKYDFLELSSSDTLTVSQAMKSFLIKNNEGICAGGANGNLYEEADKSCKVILGRLSPENCLCIKNNEGITAGGANGNLYKEADNSCKGLCITGVVLVLGTVLVLFVLTVFGFH